jgi:hypothetical protein
MRSGSNMTTDLEELGRLWAQLEETEPPPIPGEF